MNQIKIVGLVGRAGAGKTTVANHLVEHFGFVRTAFGDPLKQMLLDAGMCAREELWGEKTPQSRWLLQKIGTDIFRKQVAIGAVTAGQVEATRKYVREMHAGA